MIAIESLTLAEIDAAISANYQKWQQSQTPAVKREALAAIDSLLDTRLDLMRSNPNGKTPI